jgi:cell division protein FtsZ
MPRFASEEEAETRDAVQVSAADEDLHEHARIFEYDAEHDATAGDEESSPEPQFASGSAGDLASRRELLPVPASVFDDDFFQRPVDRGHSDRESQGWNNPAANDLSPTDGVQLESEPRTQEQCTKFRVPAFAGYAGTTEPEPTTDELDIPAFLRRNH